MDTREIKREANLLYQDLLPVLKLGKEYEQFVLTDLAKVILIFASTNKDITSNELLGFLTIYAQIKNDRAQLDAVNQWDFSFPVRRQYEKETIKILLALKTQIGKTDKLILPSLLNQIDEKRGTNLLNKTVNSIYRFAQVIVKADGQVSMQEMSALSSIWQLLHTYENPEQYSQEVAKEVAKATEEAPSKEGLDKVMDELNQLIGMENIKTELKTLTNFLKIQKTRSERGLAKTPVSLHSVFCGPPGTGKTTVARLISRIFKELGFLEKGHLVETDRAGMVADYIGGTAKKVDEKVTAALDGVLFIDEAYALTPEDSSRDFGQEAVDVLLKRMEDHRSRLVVIAAGYTDEMSRFIESNPGLKSRFNRYFYFNDYTPDELVAIFNKLCKDSHFKPTEAANEKLRSLLTTLYENRDRTFGNARLVRNLFEKTIEQQANRLAVITNLTDEILTTIQPEDIPTADALTPRQMAAMDDEAASPPPAPLRNPVEELTTLINQTLQPQGISAKVSLRDDRLQVMFEGDPVPDRQQMAAVVGAALKTVQPQTVNQIQLYARQPGDEFPAWSREFVLGNAAGES